MCASSHGNDEAAKKKQEADEVDALADEHAEHGVGVPRCVPLLPLVLKLCARLFRVLMWSLRPPNGTGTLICSFGS